MQVLGYGRVYYPVIFLSACVASPYFLIIDVYIKERMDKMLMINASSAIARVRVESIIAS